MSPKLCWKYLNVTVSLVLDNDFLENKNKKRVREMCQPVGPLSLAGEPDPRAHGQESGAPPRPRPPASVELWSS